MAHQQRSAQPLPRSEQAFEQALNQFRGQSILVSPPAAAHGEDEVRDEK